jgi:hypothetical protein
MIELPVTLVIAQWVLLFALALFVIVMYRQLAYLLGLTSAIRAGGGLEVNDAAPSFEYVPAFADAQPGRFRPQGAQSVLMFVNPGCDSCEVALQQLGRAAHRESRSPLRVMAVTGADSATVAAVPGLLETGVELARVDPQLPRQLYKVYSTPFAFAIDETGAIVARGEITGERDIRRLIKKLREQSAPVVTTSAEVPVV